ncbi:MAG: hypothetical protein KDD11_11890 [Acidobacteria bacterium]|nr:hypothetical protein [Acidobacteriota bacterium]
MKKLCLFPVLCSLALVLACSEGNPVAPTGSVLTVTANPSRISLSGASSIEVIGRKPDGNPISEGTEIRFSTSLGTIDGIAQADNTGVARALLRADGRSGTATVTVTTGDGMTSVTTDVLIGESSDTKPSIVLTASPNDIKIGETSRISAITRRSDGSPLDSGQTVRFFTSLGNIDSTATTDSDGIAVATLRSGEEPGTAMITAIVGSSDAATASVTITRRGAARIIVQTNRGTISRSQPETVEVTAIVRDEDGDLLPGTAVTFDSDFGFFTPGSDDTNQNGQADSILTVPANAIPEGTTTLAVRALVAGSSGDLLEGRANITVTD